MALCKMLETFQGEKETLFGIANTMLTLAYISRVPSEGTQDAKRESQGHHV